MEGWRWKRGGRGRRSYSNSSNSSCISRLRVSKHRKGKID
jgi:hypothetical protein